MNLLSNTLLLAQVSAEDVAREVERLQRNYQFLSYGLCAAWLILVGYVLMMVARERSLKREIANLKAMLEEKHTGGEARVDRQVR
jgi:CcmD family protein